MRADDDDLDDDDLDDKPQGAWVLARYCFRYTVSLHFVVEVKGRPQADWHTTSEPGQAYRWNSYQAARKFQRTHRRLRGFKILNLAALHQHSQDVDRTEEEWIMRDRSDSARSHPPGV